MKHPKATLILGAVLTALTLTTAGSAIAQQGASQAQTRAAAKAEARAPKVLVVAFHADWCGGCKVLGPRMMNEVLPSVQGEPLLVVKLDMTDKASVEPEYMLSALGLGHLWSEYGGKTGFALVVDAQTKQVIGNLGHRQDASAMQRTLKTALKS